MPAVDRSLLRAEQRARAGTITYPAALPIATRRDDLLAAIGGSQVVIVAGETGSGKSTQLPKLCLELGRGVNGLIGHTQPRRVAARTIAERIASELGTDLGTAVGYTVRFNDRVGDSTLIKVMTDGILLAEIQRDRTLSRYDTLIIDEAHERSLNTDFLLGYLTQLLPRRPDLKLIVTSATIDTARFAAHFGGAPVIEVSGRTFPVEMRYRPFGEDLDDERDQVQAICDAVDELSAEGPGDVLVFLSGEREIHDTADALRRLQRRNTDILALYARLSAAEQHRIFQPHTGRRIVLATNVAETSLTVPGVRYVVDAGAARMSRYSHRLKVQRLPIEPISQASANQRAGRCGRVAPGICIRLYSEDDFRVRPAFTEPEILRTNLASVILQMTALGLGDVVRFPFLDPPDSRSVRDGIALLDELGALEPGEEGSRRLTLIGRRLARLPIDPRFGRMVIEAERHGCVREVLIIAAGLSIQDPRERPTDSQQAADEAHRRFVVDGSDFLGLIEMWDYLRDRQQELSSSQFRRLCRTEFFNYLRVREWQDLYRQLREATAGIGITSGSSAGHPDRVHQAVLAGLLSHLGLRDGESREFRGARGSRFVLAPGSTLAKKPPSWVMAAELVETNRLWGRMAAAVQPEWAERVAGALVKRSYGEPRWDARNGRAVTSERVTLYGLPLVAARTVGYDRVDRDAARAMFIRNALVNASVEGVWTTRHPMLEQNRTFIDDVRSVAERVRRWNLVDDEAIFHFYDQRVGRDVVSTRHFDKWWKREREKNPDSLRLTLESLTAGTSKLTLEELAESWPNAWRGADMSFPLTYRFEPGEIGDGVTVHIPITVLNRVGGEDFDWNVPGFRDELVAALIRTLPKHVRRNLTPLAETAAIASSRLDRSAPSILPALAGVLSGIAHEAISAESFSPRDVADHLRLTFSIEGDDGSCIAIGKDLDALRSLVGSRSRAAIANTGPSIERSGLIDWIGGDLAQVTETRADRGGHVVRGYPALVDDGDSVSVRVFTKPEVSAKLMRGGVRRLLLLTVPIARKGLEREVSNTVRLAIGASGRMTVSELIDDSVVAATDELIDANDGPPWHEEGFRELQAAARATLNDRAARALRAAGDALVVAITVEQRLDQLSTPALRGSVADMRTQLNRLVRGGFVTAAGTHRLADVIRYLRAIERRLEKLPENPVRDQRLASEARALEERYTRWLETLLPSQVTRAVVDAGWMIEELRVSLFAQTLGTSRPVSAQRIGRELDRLAAATG